MNILSLFDGISCGQVALNKAKIKYDTYFSSEINPYSIKITQHHFPGTVQLGGVETIDLSRLPKIDLLIGGSPCQDLSFAKVGGKGLGGERSGLFFEYVKILKYLKPTYFLLENVRMKKDWSDIISTELGVEPIEINSNLVSAQNRKRLYWTNIPNIIQPVDKGLVIKDIIFDDSYKNFTGERITKTKVLTKNYVKWSVNDKNYWSHPYRAYYRDGKMCCIPKFRPGDKLNIVVDLDKDIFRRIHPIEAERCQTLPDNYTDVGGISTTRRLELVGDGWTVDVIAHILRGIS